MVEREMAHRAPSIHHLALAGPPSTRGRRGGPSSPARSGGASIHRSALILPSQYMVNRLYDIYRRRGERRESCPATSTSTGEKISTTMI